MKAERKLLAGVLTDEELLEGAVGVVPSPVATLPQLHAKLTRHIGLVGVKVREAGRTNTRSVNTVTLQ